MATDGWAWVMEAGFLVGWTPDQVKRATLPELNLALRAYLRRIGKDPDRAANAMHRDGLDALMKADAEGAFTKSMKDADQPSN